ncbi:MAG TPA: DUF2878 family protein [Parachlamydiaceae bacterium]|nr:DUF2878 family protein [Parachlamydiaceae bacterium]
MNSSVLNSLCYTVGWFWCVLVGIHGYPILAAMGAIILTFIQLYHIKQRDVGLYIQDLFLVVFSIPLGILIELFFTQIGFIKYSNTTIAFPPIWIISLYPLFSLLINHSLKVVKKSYPISFLMGFLGAPLSYMAGRSLGGLTFPYSMPYTWIILGISWGLFLCILVKIARILEKSVAGTLKDRDSKETLKLLYDGDCPLCNREICMLQPRDRLGKIKFVDIASKEYTPKEHGNVDYNTAMLQIHAVDSNGNLLVGLPAFAKVYARCNLLLASTMLRIPFMQLFLGPIYRLFASKRLWITGRTNLKDES